MQRQGLSVIIPTLNERERITGLLSYLLNDQPERIEEVIVVDAAKSDDDIEALVEKCGALYIKSLFSSRAAQMNEGASIATGKYLAFLHADVRPPIGFASSIKNVLNSGFDFGYFSYRFDKDSWLLKVNAWFTQFKGVFTGGGDQILFLSSALYEESGGYDTLYSFMEDYEYHSRLLDSGFRYFIVRNPALVSARKYEYNSYFKVNIINLYTLISFKMGKNPALLKANYSKLLGLMS